MVAPQPPPAASLMSQCRAATSPDQTRIPDPRSQIKYTQIKQSQIEPATNPANQEIKEAFGWGEGGKYPGLGRNEERGINEIK